MAQATVESASKPERRRRVPSVSTRNRPRSTARWESVPESEWAQHVPSRDRDPSDLTIDMMRRELHMLDEKLNSRLGGMDEATKIFDANLNRVPTQVDREISHLRDLMQLEFRLRAEFLRTELALRDDRVRQAALDTKAELASALQAAEKSQQKQTDSFTVATDKAERFTTKQIDANAETLRIAASSLNDKIAAVDGRVTRFEGHGTGTSDSSANSNRTMMMLIAVVAVGSALFPHLTFH